MRFLRLLKSIFWKPNSSKILLESKPNNRDNFNLSDEEIQAGFDEVFIGMLTEIHGLTEIEKSDIRNIINRAENGFRSPHLYQDEVWNRYFKGRDWSWKEYEDWNEVFTQLDRFPQSFPDKVSSESIDIEEILSKFKVEQLRQLCLDFKVQVNTKSKKSDLINCLSSIPTLSAHAEVKLKHEAILNKFRFTLYDLFMRTARFRAQSLNELRRHKKLGVRKYEILHVHEVDKEFVDMALKKNPESLHPTFPSDVSMKLPIINF